MIKLIRVSFLFQIIILFIFNSSHSQDTTFRYNGNKKIRVISNLKGRPIFKNDKESLSISTLDIVSDTFPVQIDYKPVNISTNKILFKDSLYDVSVGKFETFNKTTFNIGISNHMLYLKYKKAEKKIVFEDSWDAKFFGYRKLKGEMDFFFCLIRHFRSYPYLQSLSRFPDIVYAHHPCTALNRQDSGGHTGHHAVGNVHLRHQL